MVANPWRSHFQRRCWRPNRNRGASICIIFSVANFVFHGQMRITFYQKLLKNKKGQNTYYDCQFSSNNLGTIILGAWSKYRVGNTEMWWVLFYSKCRIFFGNLLKILLQKCSQDEQTQDLDLDLLGRLDLWTRLEFSSLWRWWIRLPIRLSST